MNAYLAASPREWVSRALGIAVALILTFCMPVSHPVSADGASVSIADTTIAAETKVVPIELTAFKDLGAITVSLGWDPAQVDVSLSNGTLPGGAILGNPDSANPVHISYFIAGGFSGDAVLAYVTITPKDTGQSQLRLDAPVCVDTDANPIKPVVSSGALTVLNTSDAPSNGDEDEEVDADANGQSPPPSSTSHIQEDEQTPHSTTSSTSVAISPAQVPPHQEATVSVTVCNSEGEDISRIVSMLVDGVEEQSRSVVIAPGHCQEVSFSLSRPTPGTYAVSVDGLTGHLIVLPAMPPPPAPPDSATVLPPTRRGPDAAILAAVIGAMLILIAVLVFFFRRA
ncbi:MAG: hypothetical protein GX600_05665 [Dehalococcoidia bacterium]|nr:hypothetical protein [Dehalococcoidia bacterium]